jgi:predicted Zn-dependent protease
LVGIVGHELSHLDRGHQLARVRRMKLAERTFSSGDRSLSPEEFFAAGTTVLRAWTRPFQPEDEVEADRDGATWAYRTGYDPREMARLFENLQRRQAADRIPLPDFLRSHPLPLDRHGAIMGLYQELQREQPSQDLYVGRENLRRRVAHVRRESSE